MKNLIAFILLLVVTSAYAQKIGPISLSYGKEITDDKQKIVKIAGETNDIIYTLAYKGKKVYIKTFTKDYNPLKTNLIEKEKLESKDKKLLTY